MSQISPKIITVDLEKAFTNVEDQDSIFSLVEYLDDNELTLLHEVLRTHLVLKVIGHDRRNPDVRHLLARLNKQWQVLERTIKRLKVEKSDQVGDVRTVAITLIKSAINEVKPQG